MFHKETYIFVTGVVKLFDNTTFSQLAKKKEVLGNLKYIFNKQEQLLTTALFILFYSQLR